MRIRICLTWAFYGLFLAIALNCKTESASPGSNQEQHTSSDAGETQFLNDSGVVEEKVETNEQEVPHEDQPSIEGQNLPGNPFLGLEPPYLDIAYDLHGERTTLDLWMPDLANVSMTPIPLILYIHGGGFVSNDKSQPYSENVHLEFLEAGYAFASINYRYITEAPYKKSESMPFPLPMLDSVHALQFLRYYSPMLGLNPTKIAALGQSGGAGTEMWLAFHDDLKQPNSEDLIARESTRLNCLGPIIGQSTYDPREYKEIFPGTEVYLEETVLNFYGIDRSDYLENESQINLEFDASFREASPLTHLTVDDASVKIIGFYTAEPADGVSNVHDPELFLYAAKGIPNISGFEHMTFDEINLEYQVMHGGNFTGSYLDGIAAMQQFFTEKCFF